MGLLQWLFGQKKQTDDRPTQTEYFKLLDGYRPVFSSWSGNLYESELIRAAIDAIARHTSKLQMIMTGTALPYLRTRVKHAPNPWQTWSQFLYRARTILEMKNNLFIVPLIDEYGRQTGYGTILPREWDLVTVANEKTKDKEVWIKFKFYNGETTAIELNRVGILTRYQFRNDLFGEPNNALDDTMQLIEIQRQGIEESAKNSASYRLLAKVSNFTKADDLSKERQRFDRENFQNGGGGLLLLPNTYTDVQQMKQQAYTVDTEQLKLIQKNVYDYFGVNEEILQNKATGDAWAGFYEGCIEPFALQLADVITRMTFTDVEQTNDNGVYFTANRLQYLSNADKLNVSASMLDRGIMSINEVRAIWNLEPVPGGDARIIRGEYYNATDKIDEQPEEEPAEGDQSGNT